MNTFLFISRLLDSVSGKEYASEPSILYAYLAASDETGLTRSRHLPEEPHQHQLRKFYILKGIIVFWIRCETKCMAEKFLISISNRIVQLEL